MEGVRVPTVLKCKAPNCTACWPYCAVQLGDTFHSEPRDAILKLLPAAIYAESREVNRRSRGNRSKHMCRSHPLLTRRNQRNNGLNHNDSRLSLSRSRTQAQRSQLSTWQSQCNDVPRSHSLSALTARSSTVTATATATPTPTPTPFPFLHWSPIAPLDQSLTLALISSEDLAATQQAPYPYPYPNPYADPRTPRVQCESARQSQHQHQHQHEASRSPLPLPPPPPSSLTLTLTPTSTSTLSPTLTPTESECLTLTPTPTESPSPRRADSVPPTHSPVARQLEGIQQPEDDHDDDSQVAAGFSISINRATNSSSTTASTSTSTSTSASSTPKTLTETIRPMSSAVTTVAQCYFQHAHTDSDWSDTRHGLFCACAYGTVSPCPVSDSFSHCASVSALGSTNRSHSNGQPFSPMDTEPLVMSTSW